MCVPLHSEQLKLLDGLSEQIYLECIAIIQMGGDQGIVTMYKAPEPRKEYNRHTKQICAKAPLAVAVICSFSRSCESIRTSKLYMSSI